MVRVTMGGLSSANVDTFRTQVFHGGTAEACLPRDTSPKPILPAINPETMKTAPKTKPNTPSQLAKALGISRQNLAYHRGLPGAPKSLNVDEWKEYFALDAARMPVVLSKEDKQAVAALRLRILKAKAERDELELAGRRGEQVSRARVQLAIAASVSGAFNVLNRRLTQELPPTLVGLDAITIQAQVASAVDEALEALRSNKELCNPATVVDWLFSVPDYLALVREKLAALDRAQAVAK